ncbi:unnamed protein product [Rotaria sordida]|uniref:DDE Tnp4 domain-containing protein n=1 Tax=Rotaria sordida TaxID=392033 RepID=A0A818XJR4_9BILA|nr:unnamed protein product [Rotaria sordida]
MDAVNTIHGPEQQDKLIVDLTFIAIYQPVDSRQRKIFYHVRSPTNYAFKIQITYDFHHRIVHASNCYQGSIHDITILRESGLLEYAQEDLPTLNILQADISTLTSDQWTLLSNLVHSYDERKVISVCQRLVQEDEYLHSMKPANETLVKQFFTLLYETTELCLSSNGDLRSLSFNDRSVLLRTGADSITCYGGIFSMYQFQLRTCQSFLHSLRRIYGEHSLMLTLNSIKFIDPDIVLNKMALLLLFSSKTTCIFSSTISLDHADVSVILKIQNRYAEIAWKYLLYKYDEYQAVQKFMKLIQCLIAVIQTMSQVQSVESHVNDIETIVEHTQLKLILDDIEQFNETVGD